MDNDYDYSAGKVRQEFGKNCAIDKYFGTHIKNCAIETWKNTCLLHKFFLCLCPDSFNNCEMFSKSGTKYGHFSGRVSARVFHKPVYPEFAVLYFQVCKRLACLNAIDLINSNTYFTQ